MVSELYTLIFMVTYFASVPMDYQTWYSEFKHALWGNEVLPLVTSIASAVRSPLSDP